MICKNCGNDGLPGEAFCMYCGAKKESVDVDAPMDETPLEPAPELKPVLPSEFTPVVGTRPSSALSGGYILFAVLLLACMVLLPMYNRGWFGDSLLPNSSSVYFKEAMESFFKDADAIRYYVVQFNVAALVGGVLMFIGALARSRGTVITSSLLGGGSMLISLWLFVMQEGAKDVLDPKSGYLGIGYWVVLIMFIISFISAVSSKKR